MNYSGKFKYNKQNESLSPPGYPAATGSHDDPALDIHPEVCSYAYRNDSLLCSGCSNDFSLSDRDGECKQCPDSQQVRLKWQLTGTVMGNDEVHC